jgi:signal transduction histidine kinase
LYEGSNEHEALRYYKIAAAINDSLFNAEKVKQLQNFEFVEQQRKQQEVESKHAYTAKIKLYSLIAVLIVFLLLAIILYRNNVIKQKANLLLKQQKEEIQFTLTELKAAQSQLIQREKLASLGELTAAIAHEIQNPLNFVNNFSELNNEMVEEIKQELHAGKIKEAFLVADDIRDNNLKINHHGKRADAIVKGMLQHSRASTGKKEPTDINALADEYLRLSYHGLRAKDKDFNATIETAFDESIDKINIVPQDVGRVLLNLYNNAFYALHEKTKKLGDEYEPTVLVSTRNLNDKIEIKVKDNGMGISKSLVEKIFQPFFTTKPTGQGTGLGLSLAYDIIKAHGGELKVETKEDEGAEFIVSLPQTLLT